MQFIAFFNKVEYQHYVGNFSPKFIAHSFFRGFFVVYFFKVFTLPTAALFFKSFELKLFEF